MKKTALVGFCALAAIIAVPCNSEEAPTLHPSARQDVALNKAKEQFLAQIYRAKALRAGPGGLDGPYHDNDADDVPVLGPVDHPGPYEAQWVGDTRSGYGAASVTIYQAGDTWYMLWAENMLATASSPSGRFTRLPEGPDNPVRFERKPMHWDPDYLHASGSNAPYGESYLENPIVARIPPGNLDACNYLLVAGFYTDASIGVNTQTCGFSTSPDGVHWSALKPIRIGFGDCITVLSLLPQGKDTYIMYVTNREGGKPPSDPGYERLSKVTLHLTLGQSDL